MSCDLFLRIKSAQKTKASVFKDLKVTGDQRGYRDPQGSRENRGIEVNQERKEKKVTQVRDINYSGRAINLCAHMNQT